MKSTPQTAPGTLGATPRPRRPGRSLRRRTSFGFRLAAEMNPQVGRSLRVVEVSPPMVPTLFLFRPDCRSVHRDEIERAVLSLHETVAGQQVLTIFQGNRIVKYPVACLDETFRVLTEHGRTTMPSSKANRP